MNAGCLVANFEYTADVIRQQLREISHVESLRQPIADGHSINWLIGHIVSSRSLPLQFVDAPPVWSEEAWARYRNGSLLIGADGPGIFELGELIELFEMSQRNLLAGLKTITASKLNMPSGYADNTLFESFHYFHFHETYHLGQMTMIAELLGKRAKYVRS